MFLQYEAAHLDALLKCVLNELSLLYDMTDCMCRFIEFEYLNALCEWSWNQIGGLEDPSFEELKTRSVTYLVLRHK